jgi:hypothetical protein
MAIVMEVDEQVLGAKFDAVLPHLDERQRRLVLGAEARSLGHGGVSLVARAAGVSRATVTSGVEDLDCGLDPEPGRARRPGGGRKPLAETDPGLHQPAKIENLDRKQVKTAGQRNDHGCAARDSNPELAD